MTVNLKNKNVIRVKALFLFKDIHINKIVVSIKFPFRKQDFKYFIGDKDSEKNRPSCIIRPQKAIY